MSELGDLAISEVLKALEHSNSLVRQEAVRIWGQLKASGAVLPGLLHALHDSEVEVRLRAITQLAEIGDKAAVAELAEVVLHDPNERVRCMAVETLKKIGDMSSVPALLQALQASNTVVRSFVANALGEMKAVTAIPQLLLTFRLSQTKGHPTLRRVA